MLVGLKKWLYFFQKVRDKSRTSRGVGGAWLESPYCPELEVRPERPAVVATYVAFLFYV
jgi:hypothetical protein